MEKRRITIVCVIIYLLIVFALGRGLYGGISSVSDSFSGDRQEERTEDLHAIDVRVKPVNKAHYPGKTISKEGTSVNYKIETMVADVDLPTWHVFLVAILVIPVVIMFISAIIRFAFFVRDITRGEIFTKLNIKRMRFIAVSFLISFLFFNLQAFLDYMAAVKLFSLEGYEVCHPQYRLSFLWVFLVFTLFAEIFALGKRLKEEQELTI